MSKEVERLGRKAEGRRWEQKKSKIRMNGYDQGSSSSEGHRHVNYISLAHTAYDLKLESYIPMSLGKKAPLDALASANDDRGSGPPDNWNEKICVKGTHFKPALDFEIFNTVSQTEKKKVEDQDLDQYQDQDQAKTCHNVQLRLTANGIARVAQNLALGGLSLQLHWLIENLSPSSLKPLRAPPIWAHEVESGRVNGLLEPLPLKEDNFSFTMENLPRVPTLLRRRVLNEIIESKPTDFFISELPKRYWLKLFDHCNTMCKLLTMIS